MRRASSGVRSRQSVVPDLQVPLSRTQAALQQEVRGFLGRRRPGEQARAALETGPASDEALWTDMARMEWLGILVPEELGGSGGSLVDVCVIAEELGRSLLPSAFLSTAVLGATALRSAGSDHLLRALASGSSRVAVALEGQFCAASAEAPATVSGVLPAVLDARGAEALIVFCEGGDQPALVAVDATGPGVEARPEPSLDASREACTVRLDATPCTILLTGEAAAAARADALGAGAVALGAELVGGARACLEATVEYAGDRHQFGRPIGAFQAIKHKCVEVLVSVEAARAAVSHAARLFDARDPDAPLLAGAAKTASQRALTLASTVAVQVQGGSGFLWETDAHLYLRRAKSSGCLLDTSAQQKRALADALGI